MRRLLPFLAAMILITAGCGNSGTPSNTANANRTMFNNVTSLSHGLVAYYPFNGNADDASGNANNGVVHGATLTTDRNGTANSAYNFDGSSYIEVPGSPSLSSPTSGLSIAAWVYNNDVNSDISICAKSDTGTDGQYRFQIYPTGVWSWKGFGESNQVPVPIQQWHFVAYTWDGTTVSFYLDGTLIGTTNYTGTLTVDNNPLEIGLDTPGATEYMIGRLDELRIYNRALSPSEMAALYQQ